MGIMKQDYYDYVTHWEGRFPTCHVMYVRPVGNLPSQYESQYIFHSMLFGMVLYITESAELHPLYFY